MKSLRELVTDHAASALEILELERKDGGLGDEPTSGQEVVDYLREKPDSLYDDSEQGALILAADDIRAIIEAVATGNSEQAPMARRVLNTLNGS